MVFYTDSIVGITAEQLEGFFVGWPNPPAPETHLHLLEGSDHVVLAMDAEEYQVVGFITALSDGVLTAYISHLEVLPAWQGRGIGSRLLDRMLARLDRLYGVDLLCDPPLQPFYARHGMRPSVGMCIRNYDRQCGARAWEKELVGVR